MIRLSVALSLSVVLVGCTSTSTSLQNNREAIASWIGSTQTQLVSAWGEAGKISREDQFTRMIYVFSDVDDTIKELSRRDLDRGSKTQGFDDDLLAIVGKALNESCTATFLLNDKNTIVQAELSTFGKEAVCEEPDIPAREFSEDA